MKKWITAFAAAPREGKLGVCKLANRTVRCRVQAPFNGEELRLRFGNLFGEEPMRVGQVTVWNGKNCAEITFGGQHSLRLGRGSILTSDAAYLPVRAGDILTILMYFPVGCPTPRTVSGTWRTEHSAPGNFTDDPLFRAAMDDLREDPQAPGGEPLPGLMDLDLLTEDGIGAVAVFGDSITEMRLWFDPLADRLAQADFGHKSLLNLGISGNRLLLPTGGKFSTMAGELFGLSGLQRLDTDLLQASGIETVLLALGVNDISQPGSGELCPPVEERCGLDTLAAGISRAVRRLREAGMKVIVCTITPFGGMPGWCEETRTLRNKVNGWLRRSAAIGDFDGLIDFAKAVEDPENPDFYLPAYDSGDHLHPSATGGMRMAEEAFSQRALF